MSKAKTWVPRELYTLAVRTVEDESPHPSVGARRLGSWRLDQYALTYNGYSHRGTTVAGGDSIGSAGLLWDSLFRAAQAHRRPWVICHDLPLVASAISVWDQCTEGGWELESYCITDPPCWLDLKICERRIRLVDARNYLARSNPPRGHVELLSGWLHEYIVKPMWQWFRTDCGRWRLTSGQLAQESYRRLSARVTPKASGDKDVDALARKCYFQGTNEVFRYGKVAGPVFEYDCRGQYLHIMATQELPFALRNVMNKPSLAAAQSESSNGWAMAEVVLMPSHVSLPVKLSTRTRHLSGGGTRYICGSQLEAMLARKLVKSVRYLASFYTYPFLAPFAWHWMSMRERELPTRNRPDPSLSKLVGNSLTGWFARRRRRWQDVDVPDPMKAFGHWWAKVDGHEGLVEHRSIAGVSQRRVLCDDDARACPWVSAAITAAGRWMMDCWLAAAGWGNVYYCDTDCLHVNEQGADFLEAAGQLSESRYGGLRWKGTYAECEYVAQRWYRTGEKWRRAGVPEGAVLDSEGYLTFPQRLRAEALADRTHRAGLRTLSVRIRPPVLPSPWLLTWDNWARPLTLDQSGHLVPYAEIPDSGECSPDSN